MDVALPVQGLWYSVDTEMGHGNTGHDTQTRHEDMKSQKCRPVSEVLGAQDRVMHL